MTQQELKILTKGREKRTLEYKKAWSDVPDNMFETVCAFLNRDGGVIVLGVELQIGDELQALIGEANDSQNCSQNCSQTDNCNTLTIRQNDIVRLIKSDSQIKVKIIAKMIGKSVSTVNNELHEINKILSVRWVGSPKKGAWVIQK